MVMPQPYWRGGRGRGRGRGFGASARGSHTHRAPEIDASPSPPCGKLVETIKMEEMVEPDEKSASCPVITDTTFVASYNWVDDKIPKILIPGKPPLWTPPTGSHQLREDSGIYYRDRNAASYPTHPLEPAIVAVMQMHPTPYHVDVFACGSTFGNLLRFIRGDEKPFRMLVEVVGETVHLVRRENSPWEQILGVRGYGHTFPDAYTTWESDVKRSLSHQRVVKYRFGGLDMTVRFEGDGYIASKRTPRKYSSDGADLLDQLEGLRVNHQNPATNSDGATSRLQVDRAGETVPQESIFDLKTRSMLRKEHDILGEQLPRLWVAQISHFILAYHDRGVFQDVQPREVKQQVQEWEARNKHALRRLVSLLHHIIKTAHAHQDSELEIVRPAGGNLEIRQRASGAGIVFSKAVREDWATWLQGGAEAIASKEVNHGDGDSSGDEEDDFTACDAECGYCGKCS